MFKNTTKVDVVEQKLIYFEGLSRDMSSEFRRILDKLTDSNSNILLLLSKQDLHINTLTIQNNNTVDEIKKIYSEIEAQNHKLEQLSTDMYAITTTNTNKLIEFGNFKNIFIWSLTAVVTVTGIAASAGWLSPNIVTNNKQIISK
jgi:N-acetylglutamate synthase/N-acetylornithine aminotransferase